MKYALMEAEIGNYPVKMMARVLKVSRSGFYSWRRRPKTDTEEALFDKRVRSLWEESDGRFGARSVHAMMAKDEPDDAPSLYKVRKSMRRQRIRGISPRSKKRTTIPDKDAPRRPDLVGREFCPPVPTTVLVGDITYLRTLQGWLFLAVVIDLTTRMVVGWAMSESMTSDLVVSALEMAKGRGYVAEGAIFHSDRGSQYTSRKLALWAAGNDVRLSVGRTGSCRDNAVAESFFASLKNEMYYRTSFKTRSQARFAVIDYIECFYNRRRPHSTLGYEIPAAAMESFMERCREAFKEPRDGGAKAA